MTRALSSKGQDPQRPEGTLIFKNQNKCSLTSARNENHEDHSNFGLERVLILRALVIGFDSLEFRKHNLSTADPTKGLGAASTLAPFTLTTHAGVVFKDAAVAGKPYLAFFGFTHCPDACPTRLIELTSLMEELGADADRLTPLFITLDPERDAQQTLAEYMSAFDKRIIALRGTADQTETAIKAFKAYSKKVAMGADHAMDHTAVVFLVDAGGRFAGTLDMHEPHEVRLVKLERFVRAEP